MNRGDMSESFADIKVVGLGGGGCNAVDRMCKESIPGIDFVAVNTDAQALVRSKAPTRLRIGDKLTKGLGVGGDPNLGMMAAEESRDEIMECLENTDMVFLTVGMGGGTGTGSAPVVAEVANELGALVVAIVTKPFSFEGVQRMTVAEEGIARLRKKVDALIVIPNDRLLMLCNNDASLERAFRMADEVLWQGVQGISELVVIPGIINLDFADVKSVMSGAGLALMSMGTAKGEGRAAKAARAAITSPLLDVSIQGAKRVLFNIIGDSDLALYEVDEAAHVIRQAVDTDASIIFGAVVDPKMDLEVKIVLIAAGFTGAEGPIKRRESKIREVASSSFKGDGNEVDIPSFLRRL